MRKRHPSVCISKTDPLPVFSLCYGYDMLQRERRPKNPPYEIRNQSGIHLSLMVLSLSLPLSLPDDHRYQSGVYPPCRHLPHFLQHPPNAPPRDRPSRSEWLGSFKEPLDTSHCTFRSATVYQSAAITNADSSPSNPGPFPQRTHNCGALSERDVDTNVVLSGWLLPERSSPFHSPLPFLRLPHRKLSKSFSFFPLKDSYGTTQLVVQRDKTNVQKFAALSAAPPESVVLIQGHVRSRPDHSKRSVCFTSLTPLHPRLSTF